MFEERLRLGVLGPLSVGPVAAPIAIKGVKRRLVLARLLLDRGQVVPVDRLVDAVWPVRPPRSAVANLQQYVHDLRRLLTAAGSGAAVITSDGYRIEVPAGELDLEVFEQGLDRARAWRDGGALAEANGLLGEVLGLVRGEPLADLPGLDPAELTRLAELVLGARELKAGLDLALGRGDEALAAVRPLLARHPFREPLWKHLMVALHAQGRRAEALRAFATLRRQLVDELGVEPGEEVRATHEAILRGQAPATARAAAAPVPAQLPACPGDFVGRQAERAELAGWFATSAPVAALVCGGPGVGKSALALRVAHRIRAGFPDGQLYLHCAGSAERPRAPAQVLAALLRALGVPDAELPGELAERAGLYRSLLADRRVLVVLDDVGPAIGLAELLPATPRAALLATSRGRLGDVEGLRHFALGEMSAAESAELLESILGADRVRAEPEAAEAIVRACDHLPLALRIAGARLAGRPGWPLALLAERLADESHRISELCVGKLQVRASFALSVRRLDPPHAKAFRLLGELTAGSFPGWVAEALLAAPTDGFATPVTDQLAEAHLVQQAGIDVNGRPRYQLHDLVRCYATEAGEVTDPERAEAADRLLSSWLGFATAAGAALPWCFRPAPSGSPRWSPGAALVRQVIGAPQQWFAAEIDALAEAVTLAATTGRPELAAELALSLVPFCDLSGRYEDWKNTHEQALRTTTAPLAEAALLRGLGQVHIYRDDYGVAETALRRSCRLYREAGDRCGEAVAVTGLATVHRLTGRIDGAHRLYAAALATVDELGDAHYVAHLHNAIGGVHLARQDPATAAGWFTSALALAEGCGDEHRAAKALTRLGAAKVALGEVGAARSALREAVRTLRDLDDARCTAEAQLQLAAAELASAHLAGARSALAAAIGTFGAIGDRTGQAKALRTLGQVEARAGFPAAAADHRRRARELWPEPAPA